MRDKIEFTNTTYRNLDTGNEAIVASIDDEGNKQWKDIRTLKLIPSYRVHKYISLSSKIKK